MCHLIIVLNLWKGTNGIRAAIYFILLGKHRIRRAHGNYIILMRKCAELGDPFLSAHIIIRVSEKPDLSMTHFGYACARRRLPIMGSGAPALSGLSVTNRAEAYGIRNSVPRWRTPT